MAPSFTSEYFTRAEYLTRFLLQDGAAFAIHCRTRAITLP